MDFSVDGVTDFRVGDVTDTDFRIKCVNDDRIFRVDGVTDFGVDCVVDMDCSIDGVRDNRNLRMDGVVYTCIKYTCVA